MAQLGRDVVVVAPLVDPHLLRDEGDPGGGALVHILAVQELVDRDRRGVALRDRPDDVLRAERGVAAEEDARQARLQRRRVEHRHAPFVEGDAGVALDPGECILLADRDENVVALEDLLGFAGRDELALALGVAHGAHLVEAHAGELAVAVEKGLRDEAVEDRDAFVDRVFLFPRRRLHLFERRADDDLDVAPAEALGAAAAVHCRIAAAEDDDALANRRDVAERDRRQPVDADVDVVPGFLAPGDRQVAAARRARADEDGVPVLAEEGAQRVDPRAATKLDAELEHVAGLLVDHFLGQAKARDLGTDHAAGLGVAVEDDELVAERRQIARHRQRRRAAADARDPLAVARGDARQVLGDVVLEVGGDALQAADRHRLGLGGLGFLDPAAPASGLTGPVARASEDSRKDVRFPIDEVGVGVAAGRDQADVLRNRGVGRASPLAIDHFVKVVRIADIGGSQISLSTPPKCGACTALTQEQTYRC